MPNKIIFPLWVLGGLALLLYSFTQVDLSLTLSQASFLQQVQKSFQYIGWFNRPLSTYLYIGIVSYLLILFIATLLLVSKNKISKKSLWIIIISLAVILIPSYNAFSYDLFNYIFDARIVTFYHLNPYELKALDFPNDAMLSFMRSTHRVYPYGPGWLFITVPIAFITNEIFALTLILFKALSAVSYLGTVYFLYKLVGLLKIKNINLTVAFFALNPLVVIEALVSSHNEIVMMFFAVVSFYFLFRKKYAFSISSIILSIGVKYATAFMIPIYLFKIFVKKISDKKLIELTAFFSILAVVLTSIASGQNKNPEFQPWYLLLAAPFVPLLENKFIKFVFVAVCFVSLLSYLPLLYNGEWLTDMVGFKNTLLLVGVIAGGVSYVAFRFFPNKLRG